MMHFFDRTGLERVGVVRLDQNCWWAELEDAGSSGLLICGLCCGTLLQEEPEGRRAGEGFARGRSGA